MNPCLQSPPLRLPRAAISVMQAVHQEERLQRLEEENYFLQNKMEELNQALIFQQKQLDTLEASLLKVSTLLEQMRSQQDMREDDLKAGERPPHYDSW